MAHVVTEPCVDCHNNACVAVCPTDCFHDGERMLYIHPGDCIDCEACVPACPKGAIYREDRIPALFRPFIDLNAAMSNQTATKTLGRRSQTSWLCSNKPRSRGGSPPTPHPSENKK